MVEDKSSILAEKNIDKPSKKILFVFMFIFVLGVFLVVILIMTLNNFYAILDTGIRITLIVGMGTSILTVVIGGGGIILYFVAPDKLKKYINWVSNILP